MARDPSHLNWVTGAMITAGILGTVTSMLFSKKNKGRLEQVKQVILQRKKEPFNKTLVLGSVIGGIAGVAAAILFAPKSGTQLMRDLSHPFQKSKKNAPKVKGKRNKKIGEKIGERAHKGKEKIHQKKHFSRPEIRLPFDSHRTSSKTSVHAEKHR